MLLRAVPDTSLSDIRSGDLAEQSDAPRITADDETTDMTTPAPKPAPLSLHDRDVLRRLAAEVRTIADSPRCVWNRRQWQRLADLEGSERPLVTVQPEGATDEFLADLPLECGGTQARATERWLRYRIRHWHEIADDTPWFPVHDVELACTNDGWGVEIAYHHGADRGSHVWTPPITDLARQLPTLHHRHWSIDREGELAKVAWADAAFGDLLPVRAVCRPWWTLGLTIEAIKLIGLEPLMTLMYDDPDALHALMAWLRDDHQAMIAWVVAEGLLSTFHHAGGIGSGGYGPTAAFGEGCRMGVDPSQVIGFSESQETVGVSPKLFAKFILPYQIPLLQRFGMVYYGCCEPLHQRLDHVLTIPRLRFLSSSPWCDDHVLAQRLGRGHVIMKKPNPAPVCVDFNEPAIRSDLRRTLDAAGRCHLALILKDTHTVQGEPQRLGRWARIALEEIARAAIPV